MSKKIKNAMDVFAKYMDTSGMNPAEVKATEEHNKLELEAIEYSMDGHSHWKHKLRIVKCKQCGGRFQTNHCAVSYCTIKCVSESLAEKGITFQNVKSNYEKPLTISSETTRQLELWATNFLRALEESRIEESLNAPDIYVESPEERPQYPEDSPEEEYYSASDDPISPLDNLIAEDSFFDTL